MANAFLPDTDEASISRPTSVSRPASFLLLRRVPLVFAPHHSYRDRQASHPYEGSASFSRLTIRIATSKLSPLTKGFPVFLSHHSYPRLDAPPPCEGSASFSRLTIHIATSKPVPPTKGLPGFRAVPSVSRPASFPALRRVIFLFASHVRIATSKLSITSTNSNGRAFARPFFKNCISSSTPISFLLPLEDDHIHCRTDHRTDSCRSGRSRCGNFACSCPCPSSSTCSCFCSGSSAGSSFS